MPEINFCIVGRPNVGKSTFFNCLSKQKAIVKNEAEVTRDCNKVLIEYEKNYFYLVDTAGLILEKANSLQTQAKQQLDTVLESINGIFLLVDGRAGWLFEDQEILKFLQKKHKKIFLLINKIDSSKQDDFIPQFYKSGIKKLYPISAAHNLGIGDFFTDITKEFDCPKTPPTEASPNFTMCIIGKTNVGKSSLLNAWCAENKAIVRDEPLTTRDAIKIDLNYKNKEFNISDTAGIAKKRKVSAGLEKLAVASSLQALAYSKLAILVVDVTQGIQEQDLKLASLILEKGKSLILAFNKWDLVEKKYTVKEIRQYIKVKYPFLDFCPSFFISAKTKKGIFKILDEVGKILAERKKKLSTSDLNKITGRIQTRIAKVKNIKIFYCTQINSSCPSFLLFVNNTKLVTPTYEQFIKKQFRYYFGFIGTPIKLFWRNKNSSKV